MAAAKLQKGAVLLAEPYMLDDNFKRAAILLTAHDEEGSLGFIMNRQSTMRIDDLVDDFPEFNAPVFFGGPVETNTLHYLHCVGDLLADSKPVVPGVYWGGDFTQLKFLIKNELVLPRDIRFFVGYTGWSEGQLEEELTMGSWVTANMFPNYLFKSRPKQLWAQIMQNKGKHFSIIAEMPDSANYN